MRRWRDDEDGAIAVEFALISIVLIIILFAIIEFGIALNKDEIYTQAAREGGRVAATHGTYDEIKAAIANGAVNYPAPANPSITVDTPGTSPDAGSKPCDGTNVGTWVRVSWVQNISVDVPFAGHFTMTPTIRAVFRCE